MAMHAGHKAQPQRARKKVPNDLRFPTTTRTRKAFLTFQAKFALAGYMLRQTDDGEGPTCYVLARRGFEQIVYDLDELREVLCQIDPSLIWVLHDG